MFKKIVSVTVILIVIISISVYVYLKSFLPDYNEALFAPGLKETVTVERNRFAVPTISAENDDDLYFAWGYVNAQDRMFQMEFTRRVAQARISEFAGESTIKTDYFLKAMGFYDIAKRDTRSMSPEIKNYLQRYVDGINYYLNKNGVPLYMKLMGLKKEKWEIADATAVAMMLNWSLTYNMKHELLYHRMGEKIGKEKAKALLNFIPANTPTIMEDKMAFNMDNKQFSTISKEFAWLLGSKSASNNWVVGPEKSAYQGNLFSSDMQVHDSKMPNDFYLIRVKSKTHDAVGAQVVGLPFIVSGYNQKFAWGLTNNGADMVDLFSENIDWEAKTYRYQGEDYPLNSKEIEIKIKGKDPVKKVVYYVGRKPVLTESFPDLGFDVSLDWTGFDKINVEGFFHLNHAQNHDEFIRGANMIRMAPQNMVYADTKGNIGYRVIGSLPLREKGTGNIIQNGEEHKSNWNGNIANEDYPQITNPDRGFIATANNKVLKNAKFDFNSTYAPGYRYENIVRMLRNKENIDVDYFKKMQTNTYSVLAPKIQAFAKKYVSAESKIETEAFESLMTWDGYNRKTSVGASIYNTFYVRLFSQILNDDIGEELAAEYIISRYISQETLFKLLEDDSNFIDNLSTPKVESLGDIATAAFKESLDMLGNIFGNSNIESWHWGRIHQIKFDHVLGKSALLKPMVNYGPFPFEGDSETNNRARFYEAKPPFIANLASAPRIIVKFDPEPRGYMMLITGENEYFLSKHNTDMTDAWLKHEYFSVEEEETVYKMFLKPE
jgi:penicillin G amidase